MPQNLWDIVATGFSNYSQDIDAYRTPIQGKKLNNIEKVLIE